MYRLTIAKSALKELIAIPQPFRGLIRKKIDLLTTNPGPEGCKKLKNRKSEEYRIRIGTYLVIYSIIDDLLIIDIIKVGHRGDVYE